MNPKNTKYLFEKYPRIFIGKDRPITENLMPFGIECGDGWLWLIDNLCGCMQRYIDANEKEQVEALQVKEKFGTLRFYTNSCGDLIDGMIWFAEALSARICENCGSTVDIKATTGWISYLCPKCMKAKEE